jgi:uncharacterized protein (DUF1778 family)
MQKPYHGRIRLTVSLLPDQVAVITEAAEESGKSRTKFVLDAVTSYLPPIYQDRIFKAEVKWRKELTKKNERRNGLNG